MLTLPLLAAVLGLPLRTEIPSALIQVGPAPVEARTFARTQGQERAVILIHGLTLHPLQERLVGAHLHSWQRPDAALPRKLAGAADVFAFAYGQRATLTEVVERSDLAQGIRQLHDLGYREIVLVGHSAGGLVARHLVEDHPDLPVTRVVQVATPNLGSGWATALQMPWSAQKPFAADLTPGSRRLTEARRAGILIPNRVEFVSVVSNAIFHHNDGLVTVASQWTPELMAQRIPVHEINATHRSAVHSAEAVALVALLATAPQPRWHEVEVETARKRLLGK